MQDKREATPLLCRGAGVPEPEHGVSRAMEHPGEWRGSFWRTGVVVEPLRVPLLPLSSSHSHHPDILADGEPAQVGQGRGRQQDLVPLLGWEAGAVGAVFLGRPELGQV